MNAPLAQRLYSNPEIYDVAFGWDLRLELDFLEACSEAHTTGPIRRILEPACGTARLLLALAEREYEVVGYDQSPEMVAYASRQLGRVGGRAFRGDMVDYRPRGPFDVALNLVNSIGYLLSDDELLAHLTRIAEALRPGGIYIAQFNYAGEPEELSTFGPWTNRRENLSTTLTWSVVREDLEARRSHQHCTVVERSGGGRRVIEEDHLLRLWTQEDFDRLIAGSPLELVAVYHDRFEPFPIEEPRTGEYGNLYHVLARRD